MARDRDYDAAADDLPPVALGPLDKMFRDTNIVVLVLFGFCCGWIAFVLSLIAYLTAKDPKAKGNALVVLLVGLVMGVVGVVVQFSGLLAGGAVGPAPGR